MTRQEESYEIRPVQAYERRKAGTAREGPLFSSIEGAITEWEDAEDEFDDKPDTTVFIIYNKHQKVAEERIIYHTPVDKEAKA